MLSENPIVEHHLPNNFLRLKLLWLCEYFLVLHLSFELSEHRVSILVVKREFFLNFPPLGLRSTRWRTRSDFDWSLHSHSDRRPPFWLGFCVSGVLAAHSGCFVSLKATRLGKRRRCVGVEPHLRGGVESFVLRRWLDTSRLLLVGVNLTEIYDVFSV